MIMSLSITVLYITGVQIIVYTLIIWGEVGHSREKWDCDVPVYPGTQKTIKIAANFKVVHIFAKTLSANY